MTKGEKFKNFVTYLMHHVIYEQMSPKPSKIRPKKTPNVCNRMGQQSKAKKAWCSKFGRPKLSAYGLGLTGPEAVWTNHKYHGYHTLPPDGFEAKKGAWKEAQWLGKVMLSIHHNFKLLWLNPCTFFFFFSEPNILHLLALTYIIWLHKVASL